MVIIIIAWHLTWFKIYLKLSTEWNTFSDFIRIHSLSLLQPDKPKKKKIILASGMEIKIILKIKEKILENLKDPLPYDSIIHDNIL